MEHLEILAPAGSPEALLPAVRLGADAVYLAGKAFGARANARNFDRDGSKRRCATAMRGTSRFISL